MLKKMRAGFTLVELALSLVFIGILSISVVLIINNTISSYRRGLTLNHINTVGMDIVDDFRSAVQNASSRSIVDDCITYYSDAMSASVRKECVDDGAYHFVSITQTANVYIDGDTILSNLPVFGAFCTGTYSYIWNSGYFVDDGTGRYVMGYDKNWATLKYRDENNDVQYYTASKNNPDQPFRILKVRDDTRAVCAAVVRPYEAGKYAENYSLPSPIPTRFDISEGYGLVTEDPVELILADEYNDLVVYDLEVARPAESTTRNNSFYAGSFILGTIKGGINILAKGRSCEAPNNYEVGNFDYCAINKFSFAVQAGGEVR